MAIQPTGVVQRAEGQAAAVRGRAAPIALFALMALLAAAATRQAVKRLQ